MTKNLDKLQPVASEPTRGQPKHDIVQFADIVQFVQFAWRRKWLIALGLVIGVASGAAYCVQCAPTYQSKAQVLVMKKRPHGSSGADAGLYYFEDDVETHVSLLKSPWFASELVDKGMLRRLPSLAEEEDQVRAMISCLSVSCEKREEGIRSPSRVLNLSFSGPNREDCPIILNAVVERYADLLNELSRDVNEDALKLISRKAKEIQEELSRRETEYQEFRKETPVVWNGEEGNSWSETRLAEIESKKLDLGVRRAEIETQLEAINSELQQNGDRAALTAVIPEAFQRAPDPIAEEHLLRLLLEEKALLRWAGPGHLDVLALRDQIELAREFLRPSSVERANPAGSSPTDRHADLAEAVDVYVRSLEQELRDVKASEGLLAEQSEQERKQAKETAYYEFRDRQFRNEVTRLEQFYDSLIEQLRRVDLSKDLVGYDMRVIAPVSKAAKTAPRALLVFSVTIALGILMGLGFGGLADARDKGLPKQGDRDDHRRSSLEQHQEAHTPPSGNGEEKEPRSTEMPLAARG